MPHDTLKSGGCQHHATRHAKVRGVQYYPALWVIPMASARVKHRAPKALFVFVAGMVGGGGMSADKRETAPITWSSGFLLPPDILQYYLRCSVGQINPFQQVSHAHIQGFKWHILSSLWAAGLALIRLVLYMFGSFSQYLMHLPLMHLPLR